MVTFLAEGTPRFHSSSQLKTLIDDLYVRVVAGENGTAKKLLKTLFSDMGLVDRDAEKQLNILVHAATLGRLADNKEEGVEIIRSIANECGESWNVLNCLAKRVGGFENFMLGYVAASRFGKALFSLLELDEATSVSPQRILNKLDEHSLLPRDDESQRIILRLKEEYRTRTLEIFVDMARILSPYSEHAGLEIRDSKTFADARGKNGKQVDPDEVEEAFRNIIENNGRKKGPRPVRAERIQSVFRGRENDNIPLEEFAAAFSDGADPEKNATGAIGWLNTHFEENENVDFEIERVSSYRIVRKKSP